MTTCEHIDDVKHSRHNADEGKRKGVTEFCAVLRYHNFTESWKLKHLLLPSSIDKKFAFNHCDVDEKEQHLPSR